MSVRIFNRQRKLRVDLARLRRWVDQLQPESPIEVSLVTDRVINELMGKDASARFRFIMERADEAEELDV